jgi:Na+-driven multidrug efflux pump
MRVDSFALLPSQAFSMGVSTYTGQNIGAGKDERLKPGMYATLRTSLIVSAVMITAMLLFGRNVLGLFTQTTEVIDMSMGFIYTMLPVYFLAAINMTLMGVMRGAGDSIGTMWISVLMNVIIKLPATILIIHLTMNEIFPNGNPRSTFYGMLVSMAFGFTITIIYYRLGKWKNKSVVKAPFDASALEY